MSDFDSANDGAAGSFSATAGAADAATLLALQKKRGRKSAAEKAILTAAGIFPKPRGKVAVRKDEGKGMKDETAGDSTAAGGGDTPSAAGGALGGPVASVTAGLKTVTDTSGATYFSFDPNDDDGDDGASAAGLPPARYDNDRPPRAGASSLGGASLPELPPPVIVPVEHTGASGATGSVAVNLNPARLAQLAASPEGQPREFPRERDFQRDGSREFPRDGSRDFSRGQPPAQQGGGQQTLPARPQDGGFAKKDKFQPHPQKFDRFQKGQPQKGGAGGGNGGGGNVHGVGRGAHGGKQPPPAPGRQWGNITLGESVDERAPRLGDAFDYETLNVPGVIDSLAAAADFPGAEPFDFADAQAKNVNDLVAFGRSLGLGWKRLPRRPALLSDILAAVHAAGRPIHIRGTLEILENGNGLLVYLADNYRVKELSAFVPRALVTRLGLQRGHEVRALALPAREGETAPVVARVLDVMGEQPAVVGSWTPFTELTPYYPTKRIFLETSADVPWHNLSMRCIDLLCPIGFGQRGLIVAPPRTGKTILLQGIANAINRNNPEAHLIILLVDERPEEVTDFKRMVKSAEIVSSTFDESAESHVHAAEMVIERARRMVEAGRHVVILLDSITRLARAYNTMMPSTGKILSGGVESNALSKPKRFFGSARNIEGGGSLTILGTALVETGSKMDEVIFEEFKGTGNMELDLDRDLSNKRIFPAISFERSGTRKEELLYHPDELQKVYALRRAMKGVPSVDAMEQLIHRIKKTANNIEFLMTLGNG
ncbi:MAG: transcription termination factor Rho [Puniceicoccales bacterium]|jgi:transcription termination factor Rho|nr:transcription termination factor Rho [Puniceicoccales bacterium]